MVEIPPSLRLKGAVVLARPSALAGRDNMDANAEIAFTADGQMLVRTAGGFLSGPKVHPIALDALRIACDEGRVFLSGGVVTQLELQLDPASCLYGALASVEAGAGWSWGPGPGWTDMGLVHAVVQVLDRADPRQPPPGRAIGGGRSTSRLWRGPHGELRVDDPHEVLELHADRIRAISKAPNDPHAVVLHTLVPLGREWMVGLRLGFPKEVPVQAGGRPPEAVVCELLTGTVSGHPLRSVVTMRRAGQLVCCDSAGDSVVELPLSELAWTSASRTLVRGRGAQLAAAALSEEVAAWLLQGATRDDTLVDVLRAPSVAPGAGRVRVDGAELVIHTDREERVALASLDPAAVRATAEGDTTRLQLAPDLELRGRVPTVAALREEVASHLGRGTLEEASLGDLYRSWHALRTERWLWLVYGPVFLTQRLLEEAAALPREPDESPEDHTRRKVIYETLLVAEQCRAVRLRLGAAPVAMPYALLDEEAAWLDALLDDNGGPVFNTHRTRLLEGFRMHLRATTSHLSFALADVERAVSRLEPVHRPELRGESTSVWGRVGLGAAMMVLSPVSGTLTIASAVLGKVNSHVQGDTRSKQLVDHFGPQCRSSWDLLVDVAALAAVETRAWLSTTWGELAARDRLLHDKLPPAARERVRAQVVAAIQELRSQRAVALTGRGGESVGDLCQRMAAQLDSGPRELLDRLTGRGTVEQSP